MWDVVNATRMDHPFHLHGFFFQVLEINGKKPAWQSLEDVITVPPQATVRIARYPDDRPGRWMSHCHIPEHHASGMMGISTSFTDGRGSLAMNSTFDSRSLRRSATLLLLGQLLYVVITAFHTGGEANNHPSIFAAYARSTIWTAVHVAQFACIATMLGGLLALFSALDSQPGTATLANRLGVALTIASLALYGAVLAVDGVALKQAVNAWINAPEAEKAARFASAEVMRWLEWGTRSYANFTLGLAVVFAAAVVRTAPVPRPIVYVMIIAGLAYLAQGWLAGAEGFSQPHTIAIILDELLNATWMTWLLVVAWRMPRFESSPPRR